MTHANDDFKYPLPLRILHWIRAVLIICLIGIGLAMNWLPDSMGLKFTLLYPNHKQFGVLVWIIAVMQIFIRMRSTLPAPPADLKPWEKHASHYAHLSMIALTLTVPIFGFVMSSTYPKSGGVNFFGITIPEFLPKNDGISELFGMLHKYAAYALAIIVLVHVSGVIKHRFFETTRDNDVLPRMM